MRGGHKFKCLGKLSNGWTDWHQIWYKYVDSCGNRHRLNTIRPSITQGVFGGYKFKRIGKLSNSWTDWHQIWYTTTDSSGNGHRLNTIRPSISHGAFWGVLGDHKFKSLLKLSNGWTDWQQNFAHMCRFIWEWIYAKQIALRDTRGTGWFRGSNIRKSGEAVKRLDRLAPSMVHVCGFIWEWTLAKYKSPHNTPGGFFWGGGRFYGVTNSNVWGSCQMARLIGTNFWYMSADSSGNGRS